MKKESIIDIKTAKEVFDTGLRDLKNKVTSAESKLNERRIALAKYEGERDKAQATLSEAVKKSGEGVPGPNDGVVSAKNKLDGLNLICIDLETNAIPMAQRELEDARVDLVSKVKGLLQVYKASFLSRANEQIDAGISLCAQWIEFSDSLLIELGIQTNYAERDSIISIYPNLGKGLSPNYRTLMGIG